MHIEKQKKSKMRYQTESPGITDEEFERESIGSKEETKDTT